MSRGTPLLPCHRRAGARLVDFHGWLLPLHYGSQLEEHHRVRRAAGLFDVSHMTVLDLEGPGAEPFLRHLLALDVAPLAPGQARYGCMLNPRGGVIDDLIAYRLGPARFRLVLNAATRERDLAWMREQGLARTAWREREDLAMLALQGPEARALLHGLLGPEAREAAEALAPFHALEREEAGGAVGGPLFLARTGYTGEDGYELLVPAQAAPRWWEALVAAGATPAGLGARDTLRLEAGLNLQGADMDETVTPLEAGLGWTVAWEPAGRAFVGREALEAQRRAGVPRARTGLVLEGRGVMRAGAEVLDEAGRSLGTVTSGGFGPTVGRSVALARVAAPTPPPGARVQVLLRGRPHPARIARPPFVRGGRVRLPSGSADG